MDWAGGKDENNQRKYALTQVYILGSGPLGEGQIFIKSLYDFLLHLADCVSVHDPDREGVHATALEGHIDVLQEMKPKREPIQGNIFKKISGTTKISQQS